MNHHSEVVACSFSENVRVNRFASAAIFAQSRGELGVHICAEAQQHVMKGLDVDVAQWGVCYTKSLLEASRTAPFCIDGSVEVGSLDQEHSGVAELAVSTPVGQPMLGQRVKNLDWAL